MTAYQTGLPTQPLGSVLTPAKPGVPTWAWVVFGASAIGVTVAVGGWV